MVGHKAEKTVKEKTMARKNSTQCSTQKKTPTKKKLASTEFMITAPNASEIFLAGDFNDWDPRQYSMRKFKNGNCTKKLKLKPGRYEYQFIVDGNWCADPANPERQMTEFGSENSVICIGDDVYQN
jgi:1,4-alpha-glucan branching enzyme